MAKSALVGGVLTVVVCDAELLPAIGSLVADVTLVSLVMVPAALAVTLIVMVALADAAIDPKLQGNPTHPPWLELTELTVIAAPEKVSETDTPVAGLGPLLVIVRV